MILSDGTDVQPPAEKNQVGGSDPFVSQDRMAAGWLADFDNCCTSYPSSLNLVVYRPGKSSCKFEGNVGTILRWHFVADGKYVAFFQDFAHFASAPHYELRDVETCRLLDKWDDDDTKKLPAWANELDADSGS
jgi:hypothetical protein